MLEAFYAARPQSFRIRPDHEEAYQHSWRPAGASSLKDKLRLPAEVDRR